MPPIDPETGTFYKPVKGNLYMAAPDGTPMPATAMVVPDDFQWDGLRDQLQHSFQQPGNVVRTVQFQVHAATQKTWLDWQRLWFGIMPPEVPEVWEAYAHSLLDTPRPPVGTRAHTTAAQETAEDIVRYLQAVARQRGQ